MILFWSCICICPIYWSQVSSREWRCSWSSADRRCSNYIWVINNVIAYKVRLILETWRYIYIYIYLKIWEIHVVWNTLHRYKFPKQSFITVPAIGNWYRPFRAIAFTMYDQGFPKSCPYQVFVHLGWGTTFLSVEIFFCLIWTKRPLVMQ